MVEKSEISDNSQMGWLSSIEIDNFSKKQQIDAFMKCNIAMNRFDLVGLDKGGMMNKIKKLQLILKYDPLSIPTRMLTLLRNKIK